MNLLSRFLFTMMYNYVYMPSLIPKDIRNIISQFDGFICEYTIKFFANPTDPKEMSSTTHRQTLSGLFLNDDESFLLALLDALENDGNYSFTIDHRKSHKYHTFYCLCITKFADISDLACELNERLHQFQILAIRRLIGDPSDIVMKFTNRYDYNEDRVSNIEIMKYIVMMRLSRFRFGAKIVSINDVKYLPDEWTPSDLWNHVNSLPETFTPRHTISHIKYSYND